MRYFEEEEEEEDEEDEATPSGKRQKNASAVFVLRRCYLSVE